jgi:Fe-S-cluster containining protein
VVTVTAHDVYRIARGLGLPPAAFLSMEPAQEGIPAVRLSEGYYNVALKRTRDEACVFLLDLNGHRRCSVHAFKPRVCGIYPFTMDEDEGLWHRREMLCPTTWTLSWSQQAAMRALIRQCREELRLHRTLVSRWNEDHPRGGTAEEFLNFMIQAVALDDGESSGREPAVAAGAAEGGVSDG